MRTQDFPTKGAREAVLQEKTPQVKKEKPMSYKKAKQRDWEKKQERNGPASGGEGAIKRMKKSSVEQPQRKNHLGEESCKRGGGIDHNIKGG